MQSIQCPNCGATVFSSPVSDRRQPEAIIDCTYCGSQASVRNPNYRPDPVINSSSHRTSYTGTVASRKNQWKTCPDWQHKTTRALGYIIGGLMAPFVFGLWSTRMRNPEEMPVSAVVMFTGSMLLFFFIAVRSNKELKRRKREGIVIS